MRSAVPVLLNVSTGVVRYGNLSMMLSRKLAAVLAALAIRGGELVDRATLAVECWPDRAAFVTRGDVQTAVSNIRLKARLNGIPIEIKSRHGAIAYSCAGVTVESPTTVHLTVQQIDKLRRVLDEIVPDPKLADRIWSAVSG